MERRVLTFSEMKNLFGSYGIPVLGELTRNASEAREAAIKFQRESPQDGKLFFAVKISSSQAVHKTGSIRKAMYLDVPFEGVEATFQRLMEDFRGEGTEGVIIQPMIRDGIEFLFGASRDPNFGPVITFGEGGIFAEQRGNAIRCVCCDLSPEDTRKMFEDFEPHWLLEGPRGTPKVDEREFSNIVLSLARLMKENQIIGEIDLNPVKLTHNGVFFVDARVIVRNAVATPVVEEMPEWKMRSMEGMFNPSSCVLVGPSTKDGSVGDTAAKSMIERFDGDIHIVNPKMPIDSESPAGYKVNPNPTREQVIDILRRDGTPFSDITGVFSGSLRENLGLLGVSMEQAPFELRLALFMKEAGVTRNIFLHRDLESVPKGVELGVFMAPTDATPELFRKFSTRAGKNAVIITDGFGEAGREDLEEQLIRTAGECGVAYIGPNGLGLLTEKVNTMFLPRDRIEVLGGESSIATAVQSGGMGLELMGHLAKDRVPIRIWVSGGNSSCISTSDLLEYFSRDRNVKIVTLYVEGVPDGPKFFRALRDTCSKKPVIILKGGMTEVTTAALRSHTASINSSFMVFRDACRQAGAFLVEHEKTMANAASMLVTQPRPRNRRVGLITVGGGAGIYFADRVVMNGLKVAPFDEETERMLREGFSQTDPRWRISSITDPLDIQGSANNARLLKAIDVLNGVSGVGVVVALPYFQVPGINPKTIIGELGELNRRMEKPLIVVPRGVGQFVDRCRASLASEGVPTYTEVVISPLKLALEIWDRYPNVDFRSREPLPEA